MSTVVSVRIQVPSLGLRLRILAVRKMPHSSKPEEFLAEQRTDATGMVNEVKKIINGARR
jgi:hypothetical protein